MVLNDIEIKALQNKIDHPNKSVKCPRCNNEIIYLSAGNSISVKCATKNCIKGTLRGI